MSGEIEGNSDEFSLFLGLEVHRGAALTEVFGVGGEDIFGWKRKCIPRC